MVNGIKSSAYQALRRIFFSRTIILEGIFSIYLKELSSEMSSSLFSVLSKMVDIKIFAAQKDIAAPNPENNGINTRFISIKIGTTKISGLKVFSGLPIPYRMLVLILYNGSKNEKMSNSLNIHSESEYLPEYAISRISPAAKNKMIFRKNIKLR